MNIPVLLGLTWTQATPPRNWQHITNYIHKGQHKPNFPSNSWLNQSCSWLLHRAIWKWSLLIAWSRQITQISAKLKPLMRFIDPDSGNNSSRESQFMINDIHDPQFLDLWKTKSWGYTYK